MVIDSCESVNCSGKGQCLDSPGGVTCTCDVGYTGRICEIAIINRELINCNKNSTIIFAYIREVSKKPQQKTLDISSNMLIRGC